MVKSTSSSDSRKSEKHSANSLLPVIYEELRKLAFAKMANEPKGHSLQPTDLVHAAYLRLVENQPQTAWNTRGHFFGAAANAMRRILVENARRKKSKKHGGHLEKLDLAQSAIVAPSTEQDVLSLDDALQHLQHVDSEAAKLVELRFFVGLTINESAELMDLSPRKANMIWAYARAWLRKNIAET